MKKVGFFIFNLIAKCNRDQIIERANGLTLSVLLAFFPFLIFLMSLMGFLDLDIENILTGLYSALPSEISALVGNFFVELSDTRSTGLLSASLFFSVYNTTNGFRSIMRNINLAYGVEESRGLLAQIGLSFVLMLIFSSALIVMLALLVFGRQMLSFVFPAGSELFFALISNGLVLVILFLIISFIYKLACEKTLLYRQIFPGAAVTVFSWFGIGLTFGFFTQNFTQLPTIYGSIAGVFLLVLWLNAVGIALLFGNEINCLLVEWKGIGKKKT